MAGGIWGVASRRRRADADACAHILQYVFDEDHKRGCLFSTLFPFSHAYYRKFGYELCAYQPDGTAAHRAAFRLCADAPARGAAHREADGFDVIREIESRILHRYNMAMPLTDRQYKKALAAIPSCWRLPLHPRDPNGTP